MADKISNCLFCKNSFLKRCSTDYFCSPQCNLLFSHVKNENECWIWKKAKGKDGYGRIRYKNKYIRAHRFSYEVFKGPFDSNLQVLHQCDCPLCINPDHLFLGSNEENQKDMIKKGRARKYHKFSKSDVKTILTLYKKGISQAELSKKFNCRHGHIWLIVKRKIWKHVL